VGLCALVLLSCVGPRVLGLDAKDARAKVAAGDLSFLLQAQQVKERDLAGLGPEAAFFAALKLGESDDADRALVELRISLLRVASGWKNPRGRVASQERLVALLVQSQGASGIEEANRLSAALKKEFPEEERIQAGPVGGLLSAEAIRAGGKAGYAERARSYFFDTKVDDAFRTAWLRLSATQDFPFSEEERSLVGGRILFAERDYGQALRSFLPTALSDPAAIAGHRGLLSDLGSCLIYGVDAETASSLLDGPLRDALQNLGEPERSEGLYRVEFYGARLARKTGEMEAAARRFARALALAPDAEQRDACIWYLLELAQTPASFLSSLRTYLPSISEASTLIDLADLMCGRFIAEGDWVGLRAAYDVLRPYLDGEGLSRWTYILGRATSLGFFPGAGGAAEFYRQALATEGGASYYKILASYRLGEHRDPWGGQLVSGGPPAGLPSPGDKVAPTASDEFIASFFRYGAESFAYPFIQGELDRLSSSSLATSSRSFSASGHYPEAIRTASLLLKRPDVPRDSSLRSLLYIRPFRVEVTQAADLWNLEEYLLYGLAFTESAFEASVVSRSGAVGLTQLMPSTGAEVARKLRSKTALIATDTDPALADPATNLLLGAYYYQEMRRRGGTPMIGLLAYNAGLSRVRSWLRNSPALPEDLFMETLPYSETREYGKKVLAAAAAYGYLYYGIAPEATAASLLPDIIPGGTP